MDKDARERDWGVSEWVRVPSSKWCARTGRPGPPPLPGASVAVMTLELSSNCSGWELPSTLNDPDDDVIVVDEFELTDVEPQGPQSPEEGRADSLAPVACEHEGLQSHVPEGGQSSRIWLYGTGVAAAAAAVVMLLLGGYAGPARTAWGRRGASSAAATRTARLPAGNVLVMSEVLVVVSPRDVVPRPGRLAQP